MVAACTEDTTDDPSNVIQATLSSTTGSDVWQVGCLGMLIACPLGLVHSMKLST